MNIAQLILLTSICDNKSPLPSLLVECIYAIDRFDFFSKGNKTEKKLISMSPSSSDARVALAVQLLAQSPPGEVADVLQGMFALIYC